MIDVEMRRSIFLLHQGSMGIREISRRLGVSRNTVRRIIASRGRVPDTVRSDKQQIDSELLRELYDECDSRIQRVHEKLVEEKGLSVKYSTLTRMLREYGISKSHGSRCDRVADKPGIEMQHDTSPYRIRIGDKKNTQVVASMLYLRYSKRRYLKFYRSFNRFKMKCFFYEALSYWGYSAATCIIDNTNLARLSGTGSNAVIVAEMGAFSKQFGFTFICHAIGHANRKAGEERGFWTLETNFFPGRKFESMDDLNHQAFEWATERMYHRPLTAARIISSEAFEEEKACLTELPSHLPAPYLPHSRLIDQYGFIAFAGNFFWVPGTGRGEVTVLQYSRTLQIYDGRNLLSEYELPPEEVKNQAFSPEGMPKPRHQPNNRKRPTREEEKRLRSISPVVGAYLDMVLKPGGIERHSFVRKLFALSRRMTSDLFLLSIERAAKYKVTSLKAIERIARLYMNQTDTPLPSAEVDENFVNREAYLEGELTDQPDLSLYNFEPEEEEDDEGSDSDG